MKNKMKKFIRLLCLSLVLCMMLGTLPVFAADEAETEAADGTDAAAPATVDIVVAKKDVPQGTRLNDSHVHTVTVPNLNLPENIITDINEVYEKYSATDLMEGEYVSGDQVSSKRVSKVNNELLYQPIVESEDPYLIVTDYIQADSGKDVTALLQELIDKNPKRTIYFPDGEYLISNPLCTSATPAKSVTLRLSDGAVIKASDSWKSKDGCNYLISIGGSESANDIVTPGSYYSVIGGTLDGNGEANGIQYTAGRESLFRDICIKNVDTGIYIPRGVNNGSSDADFEDIVIYGTGKEGSYGFYVRGHDNTFTNIRVYNSETAIMSHGGTSLYKSVYVYSDPAKMEKYENTVGFHFTSWAIVTDCYVENFATGFKVTDNRCILSDCAVKWTDEACTTQTAIYMGKNFVASGIRADFLDVADAKLTFVAMPEGSSPAKVLEGCMFDTSLLTVSSGYLVTPVIPLSKKD